jgi:hypothetical protein
VRPPAARVAARLRFCIGQRARAEDDVDETEWVENAGETGRLSSSGDADVGESPPRTFVSLHTGVRRKRSPVKMERPLGFPPPLCRLHSSSRVSTSLVPSVSFSDPASGVKEGAKRSGD